MRDSVYNNCSEYMALNLRRARITMVPRRLRPLPHDRTPCLEAAITPQISATWWWDNIRCHPTAAIIMLRPRII